jgi:dihydrolipoamide dehydrogenase
VDEFDLVVIGGGTGGYTSAIRATQLGLSAAIVERDKIGGTCLHRGCIPTKAWLETAYLLQRTRAAGEFGIRVDGISLDYPALVSRQKKVVDTLHKGIRGAVEKKKIEIIQEEGRFKSPTEIAVGRRILKAKNVVIATGSRPKDIPGLETDGLRVVNSDQLLELEELPKSILIIGAGAVGSEFASFFVDIGTDVTLIEMMPTILPLEDEDIGRALAKSLVDRGANVLTSARVLTDKTKVFDNTVELVVEHEGKEKKLAAEMALVAVGREAVTDDLDLGNTGVKLEKGWVKADEFFQTDEPNVYAVGDAIGGLLLAHVAAAEGFIAAEHMAGRDVERLDYTRVPRVTYSRPQVAAVGLSEKEAREAGYNARSRRFSFEYNAMALIQGEDEGFVKVVYDVDSGDLLGVHIIGPQASELISEAALGRFLEASAWEIGTNIHAHPTLSETLGEAAQLSAEISIYW